MDLGPFTCMLCSLTRMLHGQLSNMQHAYVCGCYGYCCIHYTKCTISYQYLGAPTDTMMEVTGKGRACIPEGPKMV